MRRILWSVLLLSLSAPVVALLACSSGSDARAQGRAASPSAPSPASRSSEPEHPERFSDPPIGEKLELTDAEWHRRLTDAEYAVMREQGTEPAFSGRWHDNHADGVYRCAACGAPLFSSDHKFDSGTGWPSFYQPIAEGRVETETDRSLGVTRTEVHCARCGAHLGHVFEDGPPPTGQRYCINSIALDFDAADDGE